MKRIRSPQRIPPPLVALLALAIALTGAFVAPASAQGSSSERSFSATLLGVSEVPPVDTPATGLATFTLNAEGTALAFRLSVSDIRNVVASHIHIAPPGVNGPIVVFLFGDAPPGGGPVSGLLSEGTIRAEDFVGPLAGRPFADLITALETGNAYVNVHTNDGVAPVGTGAGDVPTGEIRGQVVETTPRAPPCPEGLQAEARENGSIELRWGIPEGVDPATVESRVYRATGDGGFALLFTVTAEDREQDITDTTATAGGTFRYTVRLFDGERESTGCPVVEVTAIPFFPTLATGLLASLAGVGAYLALRRRE